MLFELLTNLDEVFARCTLMAFDHNVVLSQNFDVLEKIMVDFLDFVVNILFKELDEFVWIPHDLEARFLGSILLIEPRGRARVQKVLVLNLLEKSLIQRVT